MKYLLNINILSVDAYSAYSVYNVYVKVVGHPCVVNIGTESVNLSFGVLVCF